MATVADYLGNASWVQSIEQLFDSYDLNKNGYVTRQEFHTSVNKLARNWSDWLSRIDRKPSKELTEALRLAEGVKANKKTFLELLGSFVVGEKAKIDKGEVTLIEKHNVALFDVVDRHHDGNLTWEEYKSVMEASGFEEATAITVFDMLDKDKNGKIDRKKLASADLKFWTSLEGM